MKLITTKFKSGGLHEKHVLATWNLGDHFSIRLDTGKPKLGRMCTPLDIRPDPEKVRAVEKHPVPKTVREI